jgi:hypothetical protein
MSDKDVVRVLSDLEIHFPLRNHRVPVENETCHGLEKHISKNAEKALAGFLALFS